MTKFGYSLSSEVLTPKEIVQFGEMADKTDLNFLFVSDHFHPWVDAQGQSPFVWSVIGALSQVTNRIQIGTGVTAPIIRTHPAIIAQAAATSAVMLEDRFILGVGAGENLNEHIVGQGWPPYDIRREMMIEAIEIMKLLWEGGYQSYYGQHFTVDKARIYTLPKTPPPIAVSAFGPKSAMVAAELGDGLVCVSPDKKLTGIFEKNSKNKNQPKYVQVTVCYNKNEEAAKDTVMKIWPIAGLPNPLNTELRLPADFEKASKLVKKEDLDMPMGPDVEKYVQAIKKCIDAGFDHIYLNQVGHNQEEFLKFYMEKVIPKI